MAKIMLVEDDTNLSEIYRARLEAEGYTILTAYDGEEALARAVKEKPDLIICDVMMPKISGFEMLDILRGTEGVQNTKVIMMTALSQAEDKARASALGADRYLVKSQVTLEDVVTAVKDVISSSPTPTTPNKPSVAPAVGIAPQSEPAPSVPPVSIPVAPAPSSIAPPVNDSVVGNDVPAISEPAISTNVSPSTTPVNISSGAGGPTTIASADSMTETTAPTQTPNSALPNDPVNPPAPNELDPALSESSSEEQAGMSKQIENFINQQSDAPTATNPVLSENQSTLASGGVAPEDSIPAFNLQTEENNVVSQPIAPAPAPIEIPTPALSPPDKQISAVEPASAVSEPPSHDDVNIPGKKVIQPLNDIHAKPDLDLLLAKEEQKDVENAEAKPIVGGEEVPPNNGYLGTPPSQVGQFNPNNGDSMYDPNNIAI